MNLRRGLARVIAVAAVAAVAVALNPGQAWAAAGDVGYKDHSYGSGPGTDDPTADKPESKLWFAYQTWWADMWSPSANAHHIYKLNTATQAWTDTGVAIDSRPNTASTAVYDGNQVFIASHVIASSSSKSAAGNPTYLYRYSYNQNSGTWTLDANMPATIQPYSVESLTIDEDGDGRIWAAFTRGSKVYVTATSGNAFGSTVSFKAPWVPSISGANTSASSDDIATASATAGGGMMVLWSNQKDGAVYYGVHAKGAADTAFTGGSAAKGAKLADDHVNLKALQSDAQGRVFAGVKTSLNDLAGSSPTDPLINLLVFTPGTSNWKSYPFSSVADSQTRPLVLIDGEHAKIRMLATGPSKAGKVAYSGTIYEKVADLANPVFPAGAGTPVIRDAASAKMNNATSTRQPLSSATGEVVLASNSKTLTYWHSYSSLANSGPTAKISADKASGDAPLTVNFTATTSGSPSGYSWNYGDGTPADTGHTTASSHTFTAAGTYNVTLTVSNGQGSSTSAAVTVTVTGGTSPTSPTPSPSTSDPGSGTTTGPVLFRVNAGGPAISGSPAWTADTTAAPSAYTNAAAAYSVAESTTKPINMSKVPAGTPQDLFASDRYDSSRGATMQWNFAVPASGSYTVRLYFAETNAAAYRAKLRRFGIQAEGATLVASQDIYAEAGKKTALMKAFPVTVTDGTLNLNFVRIQNNPIVSGIEVIGPA